MSSVWFPGKAQRAELSVSIWHNVYVISGSRRSLRCGFATTKITMWLKPQPVSVSEPAALLFFVVVVAAAEPKNHARHAGVVIIVFLV